MHPGDDLDLPQKAVGAEDLGETGLEYLQRDRPLMPAVLRQIHHGHPAVADLMLDRVAAVEGDLEMGEEIEHRFLFGVPPCYDSPPVGSRPDSTLCPRQARIAAPSTAGTLVQLARASSAVIRRIRSCALRWLIE